MRIYLDLETYSACELDKVGAYRYSVDPSTGINCGVYATAGGGPLTFKYSEHEELAADIRMLLEGSDCMFVFHYALFELSIIKNVLGIAIPPHRVIDTFAKAGYYGYPRGLDEAAKALQCSKLKDLQGKAVMKGLSKGLWTPEQKPEEFERLYQYCRIDVEVMREIDQKLPDLPPDVQRLWELDVEINMRGIPIDVKAVENAIWLKDKLKEQADRRMAELTEGLVTTVGQTDRIQDFAARFGVDMPDCQADTVTRLLCQPLPEIVRQVLQLRQEAGLTSVSKYDQMLRRQVGGRIYHEFDNYGAVTGRPKGRGVQTLNLPRSTQADYYAELIEGCPELVIGICGADAPNKLKEGIRGMIKAPPGKVLVGGDLSQIEARCTGWTAGDETFLSLFTSGDPYCTYGKNLWGREITKADMIERTAAKATVLSMGFGGGIGAYQRSAENYNLDMDLFADNVLATATPDEISKGQYSYHKVYMKGHPAKPLTERQGVAADIVKQRYRKDFPKIVEYWHELWLAFLHGGDAGPINIQKKDRLRILTLPSGRQLFYHDVRQTTKVKQSVDGLPEEHETNWTYQARDKRKKLWYGVVIENCAQGENHDISTSYMLQANQWIAPVVHQCYDEFMLEEEKQREEAAKQALKELVKEQPAWSKGLPIAFDVWSGIRYG